MPLTASPKGSAASVSAFRLVIMDRSFGHEVHSRRKGS
jgi:hypothetical protein